LEVTPLPTDVPVLFQQMPGEVYPLPRFWFSSKVHSTLIQLQRNGFLLNWRRGAEGDYPHYENVEENFWREFLGYKNFVEETLGGKLDVVSRCELTYVNFIGTSEFFSCPADINKVLPPIASLYDVQDDTRRLVGLNTSTTYRLTDNLSIESSVKLGRRTDTNENVALLELKAHGAPGDLSIDGARAWYKAAHNATYRFFLDFTDKRVQKELWKPR
jgi:uncharacterized protein (TIGR04255 family)